MISREKTISLLKDVVSINSMNPLLAGEQYNENKLAEFLADYLSELGLKVRFQEREGRKNVIAILEGSGNGKNLILNAHTDTVAAEGMEKPLAAELRDGKIYGRGAYDMKGGLVSCLMAIQDIVENGIELAGGVIFAGVVDEEYGSIGTELLVEEYKADAAIITEPTDERIVIAHKGFSWIKIVIHGKAAHGSKPHLGIDAIDYARKVMNGINQIQEGLNSQEHPLVGIPAIRVTKIDGGLGLSTIPDRCEIYLERRTLPHIVENDIRKEINHLLDDLKKDDPNFKADVEFIIFRKGMELSKDSEIVQILSNAYQQVIDKPVEYAGEPWWMDSALLDENNIPTVVLGPSGDGAHAKVEYVEIDSVIKIGKIIKTTILDFCK